MAVAVPLVAALAYAWRSGSQAEADRFQPAAVVVAPARTASAAGTGAQISGRVVLTEALRGQVKRDDEVLIYARLLDGQREPVALLRRHASELPLDFLLDESAATNPSLRLSTSMLLVVGARISRPGQATPQLLDWQGHAEPVPVGTRGVQVQISQTAR